MGTREGFTIYHNCPATLVAAAWVSIATVARSSSTVLCLTAAGGAMAMVQIYWLDLPPACALLVLPLLIVSMAAGGAVSALRNSRRGHVWVAVADEVGRAKPTRIFPRLGIPAVAQIVLIPEQGALLAKDFAAVPRGTGAGTAVASAALSWADSSGVTLLATAEAGLVRVYETWGFVPSGTVKTWVPVRRATLTKLVRLPRGLS